ncbi:MAG: RimK family alpha-L-glutamate ligase [Gemmatimonadetes bacterium]|nr:RimK family alpha-L-glutamate ligase [Gemmatimonadota bacterium]
MADIAVFIERYTVTRSEEMGALMRLGQVAQRLGHRLDVLFRPDMYKIPDYDALFIRALTDPLNSAYVAARMAELHGLRVIDDPDSIVTCCDKVNMYSHLRRAGVPIPETAFLRPSELTPERGRELLRDMGSPLVLKAPYSSFSMYVDRVSEPLDFVSLSRRYLRRADLVVAQRFVPSEFDWRVCVLAGEPLFVCRYMIPKKRWKVLSYMANGRVVYGDVQSVPVARVNPRVLEVATCAAAAIGRGLYGVDLKQVGDEYVVIEVNDNPTINAAEEDVSAPHVYERVIRYLVGEWG